MNSSGLIISEQIQKRKIKVSIPPKTVIEFIYPIRRRAWNEESSMRAERAWFLFREEQNPNGRKAYK